MVLIVVLITFIAMIVADFVAVSRYGRPMPSNSPGDRGTLFLVRITSLGGFAAALAAHSSLQSLDFGGLTALALILGLLLAWASIALRVWSVATLGRAYVRVVDISSEQQLITEGPYRLLRHPAYASIIFFYFGLGIAMANIASLLILAVLPPLGYVYRIQVEEPAMAAAFGPDYDEYSRDTWRLFPWVW